MTHATPAATTGPLPATPARWARVALAALALLGGAVQAVPVTVSIGGLPPGLKPVLTVARTVCVHGLAHVQNSPQPLTELAPLTVIEPVTLPSGQTTYRTRVITRYGASFDTPTTADQPGPLGRTCAQQGIADDTFHFAVEVPGLDAADRATALRGGIGSTAQTGPVTVNAHLEARTTSLTPPLSVVTRGVPVAMDATHTASLGVVQSQRLELLRANPQLGGLFTRVASLLLQADRSACLQAGGVTRCLVPGAGPVEAGGVVLRGILPTVIGRPGVVRYQFELAPTFPIGALKLRAIADARDLPAYVTEEGPQSMDLLPWRATEQTVTVQ